jgi:hypothetical protein
MKRFTTFIDGGYFMSLADIEAHSEALAIRLAITYGEEVARLYAARCWDANRWDRTTALDLVVAVAPLNDEGDVIAPGSRHYMKVFPGQYGDDERKLKTPLAIPGVTPIPLTIKEC